MKADLAIYSLVVGMSGLWVNVATMLNNKLDFYCCDNSVGFCKSSHIYIAIYIYIIHTHHANNSCNITGRVMQMHMEFSGVQNYNSSEFNFVVIKGTKILSPE